MKAKRSAPTGARAVRGSEAARRKAALLLEAWSGVRSTTSASEAMGVALPRFYQLEARALQLIVAAMEPKPRGRQTSAQGEVTKLRSEKQRLLRDVERFQALYRTAQRSLGIAMAKAPEKAQNAVPGGKRKRGPRQRARGQAVAALLRTNQQPDVVREANDGATEQGPGTHRHAARRGGGQVAAEGDPGNADPGTVGRGGV